MIDHQASRSQQSIAAVRNAERRLAPPSPACTGLPSSLWRPRFSGSRPVFARPPVVDSTQEALNAYSGDSSQQIATFDPATEQHTGCVLGIGLCAYRMLDGADGFLAVPGDDVEISYPTAGKPPKVLSDQVHGRRFLRKQDERIRLQLRVRADPQAARDARHDRSRRPASPTATRFRSSSSQASI